MNAKQKPARVTRKRKRSGESLSEDSEDGLKRRGRPRTEKPDESTADRRRTQIRLAQRAYRQRKETTLDDLRKRVSDLTSTIECMNKTFEHCRDHLISTGLTEGQLHDLSETTIRFEGFMKTVRRPSDSPDEAVAETEAPLATSLVGETSSATIQSEQNPLPIVKNVPSWIDKAALTHSDKLTQRSDIGMGYTMYTPNAFDQMVENFSIPSLAQGLRGSSQNSPFTLPFDLHAPNLLHQEPPTLSLSSSSELPAPKTYSFQEKTLGRRLHRACLEAAYHLLHDPSRRPHTFERVFKLSLLSRDRVRMATSVKRILDRGLDEPLDFWDSPTLHIGGAGTHYPDRQRQRPGGHPQREKSKFHLGMISPHMLNMLENIVQSRTAAEVSVEIEGFEGEWFDPYDIEGYLESRGIHIDPTVSFVEAEIDYAFDTAAPNHQPHSPRSALLSAYSSSGGYNSSSLNPTSNSGSNSSNNSNSNSNNERTTTTTTSNSPPWFAHNPEQLSAMQLVEPDLDGWREVQDTPPPHISGLGNVGFSDADTGSWMNFLPPSSSSDQYHQNGQAAAGMRDSGGDFMQDLFGGGSGGDGGGSYGQGAAAAANTMASPSNKKAVIIDVAKFIKVLTITGVCLGRTPGFKRQDVDRALAVSSFEAF